MNLRLLAESLTLPEVNELSNHLYDIKRRYAAELAKDGDFLLDDEKTLVDNGFYIDAIKSLRARMGLGLFESKIIVDVYRDRK